MYVGAVGNPYVVVMGGKVGLFSNREKSTAFRLGKAVNFRTGKMVNF